MCAYAQFYREKAQVILTRIAHVISRQTIASDSILSTTSPDITGSAETTLSEIGLSGSATAREVIESAASSTQTKGIVTEHRSP